MVIVTCSLYISELEKLPKIQRAQITQITRFLGSGAFGDVFEGLMKGSPSTTVSHHFTTPETQVTTAATSPASVFARDVNATTTGNNLNVGRLAGGNGGTRDHNIADAADLQVSVATTAVADLPMDNQRKVAIKTLRRGKGMFLQIFCSKYRY